MNKGTYEVLRSILDPNSLPEVDEVWEMEKFYERLYLEIPDDEASTEYPDEEPF